jgi:hypothetical protein
MPDGFVVHKGSTAVLNEVSSIHHFLSELRKDLQSKGVMVYNGDHFEFTQDYLFSSSSTAAGVVQGRAASGPKDWKDDLGKTLSEVQKEKLETSS